MNKSNESTVKPMAQITTYESGIAQASAHRIINRIVAEYLERYGITAMQWFMIGHIFDAGPTGMSLSTLTRLLGTSLPYVTNAIILLESKNIIRKNTHVADNRTKLVTISPQYRDTVTEIENGLREQLRRQLYTTGHVDRDELEAYIHVLYKIVAADQAMKSA